MPTVIFVHGTGVREDSYDASFDLVQAELGKRCDAAVARCYWGDLGSQLNAEGASIPTYDTARAAVGEWNVAGVTDEEYGVALWGALYEDPLYELRFLALREKTSAELPPGVLPPGTELAQLGKRFQITPELRAMLEKGGIAGELERVRAAITSSETYRAALTGAPAGLADHRAAVARALIAGASARVAREGPPAAVSHNARLRDETEGVLIDALGGKEYGIGGWLKAQLGGLVSKMGSRYLERRRGAVTDAATPAAGDILLYQARGGKIRDFVRQRIAEAAPPRVLLAHSLGGIACVDLLVEDSMGVDLLVTAGSQAPFLYEINALQSLPYGHALPGHFPRWLNFFDLRDMLSYVGEGVFPERVKDVEVDSRQPFPVSHSAYWSNSTVWETLLKEFP